MKWKKHVAKKMWGKTKIFFSVWKKENFAHFNCNFVLIFWVPISDFYSLLKENRKFQFERYTAI